MNVIGFKEEGLEGPLILEPERDDDAHGWFSSLLEPGSLGLLDLPPVTSIDTVQTDHKGTVRGLLTRDQAGSAIIVSIRGAGRHAVVDLRENSPTRLKHVTVDLAEVDGRGLVVPWGFGHAWQALVDGSAILRVGTGEGHGTVRGFRPDDPSLQIDWPIQPILITAKDRSRDSIP